MLCEKSIPVGLSPRLILVQETHVHLSKYGENRVIGQGPREHRGHLPAVIDLVRASVHGEGAVTAEDTTAAAAAAVVVPVGAAGGLCKKGNNRTELLSLT